jgi:pyruvate kinase
MEIMRTKIVCTLGPATDNEDTLRALIRAGMDVARMNFSHGAYEAHTLRIDRVRRLAQEENALVAIMGDLQGPKFRVGTLPAGGIELTRESTVVFSDRAEEDAIPFPHGDVLSALQVGHKLLIDDGAMTLLVTGKPDQYTALCLVVTGGKLTSNKGVSVPSLKIATSSITPKDRADLEFAVKAGVDAIALSFVRSASDVRELRQMINELGGNQLIVAKLEKPEAVADLTAIAEASDVLMVARGDLGVESAPEEVPFYQKEIIRHCLRVGKPVITATQMLQSMIESPSPTRAEASDVANAVLDGTDAVMLSAETAVGEYPVAAVQAMSRIAARAEEDVNTRRDLLEAMLDMERLRGNGTTDHRTDAITDAAVQIAREIGAKAIVCATSSGFTARMVSRHRPDAPVVCMTPHERAYKYSAFMWGVRGVLAETRLGNSDELFEAAARLVASMGLAKTADFVVITAGLPLGGGSGQTNVIKTQQVK